MVLVIDSLMHSSFVYYWGLIILKMETMNYIKSSHMYALFTGLPLACPVIHHQAVNHWCGDNPRLWSKQPEPSCATSTISCPKLLGYVGLLLLAGSVGFKLKSICGFPSPTGPSLIAAVLRSTFDTRGLGPHLILGWSLFVGGLLSMATLGGSAPGMPFSNGT